MPNAPRLTAHSAALRLCTDLCSGLWLCGLRQPEQRASEQGGAGIFFCVGAEAEAEAHGLMWYGSWGWWCARHEKTDHGQKKNGFVCCFLPLTCMSVAGARFSPRDGAPPPPPPPPPPGAVLPRPPPGGQAGRFRSTTRSVETYGLATACSFCPLYMYCREAL
jgi:hypothetical protein